MVGWLVHGWLVQRKCLHVSSKTYSKSKSKRLFYIDMSSCSIEAEIDGFGMCMIIIFSLRGSWYDAVICTVSLWVKLGSSFAPCPEYIYIYRL